MLRELKILVCVALAREDIDSKGGKLAGIYKKLDSHTFYAPDLQLIFQISGDAWAEIDLQIEAISRKTISDIFTNLVVYK
ncbi:hypothetical protein RhiirA4_485016 [Rhizophagus irregularis]|uniref:Uncharacterized protein n=1 Tax=Rhizophagus irregularis TaxID=588596 RepID=A0A2I1HPN6_9GLOM|nr:hypothetical protein RhiirA4_485016 [Rhizophagus irregularis]